MLILSALKYPPFPVKRYASGLSEVDDREGVWLVENPRARVLLKVRHNCRYRVFSLGMELFDAVQPIGLHMQKIGLEDR